MIRVCSWCKRVLGHIEPYEDHRLSHGICKECEKKFSAKADNTNTNNRR